MSGCSACSWSTAPRSMHLNILRALRSRCALRIKGRLHAFNTLRHSGEGWPTRNLHLTALSDAKQRFCPPQRAQPAPVVSGITAGDPAPERRPRLRTPEPAFEWPGEHSGCWGTVSAATGVITSEVICGFRHLRGV